MKTCSQYSKSTSHRSAGSRFLTNWSLAFSVSMCAALAELRVRPADVGRDGCAKISGTRKD